MLLPPDLRDWIEEDDLVHFVIEAFQTNHRGSGSDQMPPHMMLALLVYSYCNGIFSSRKIERATYRDVAVRYLTADIHPDHHTICKFRRENKNACIGCHSLTGEQLTGPPLNKVAARLNEAKLRESILDPTAEIT